MAFGAHFAARELIACSPLVSLRTVRNGGYRLRLRTREGEGRSGAGVVVC